jgi:predicted metalloprotease
MSGGPVNPRPDRSRSVTGRLGALAAALCLLGVVGVCGESWADPSQLTSGTTSGRTTADGTAGHGAIGRLTGRITGPHSSQGTGDEFSADLRAAVQSTEHFWRGVFEENGRRFTPVTEIYGYDRTHPAFCGNTRLPSRNAAYCLVDDTIAVDRDWLQSQYQELGDAFVFYLIGHEYAHGVQQRLGITNEVTIVNELQADCFAGSTLRGELAAGNLSMEDGDAEELAESLRNVSDPEGVPWLDPRAHGSVSQRTNAFVSGYRNGLSSCMR